MKVAILHHHLNPGGVTRIIQSQIESLINHIELPVKIITGACPNPEEFENDAIELIIDPIYDYLRAIPDKGEKKIIYDTILKTTKKHIDKDYMIHFHNLNLGKNPIITQVFSDMATEGFNLINHCHDFAEDRPNNMNFFKRVLDIQEDNKLSSLFYPKLKNYFYATLNQFDFDRLKNAGIKKDHLFLLPNPVSTEPKRKTYTLDYIRKKICSDLDLDHSKMIITYPVRVIRRKNIGEFILLSVLFNEDANWLVTQPPKNPVEYDYYKQWIFFCKEKKIDIHFEVGMKVDFEELIIASDYCITTSYREGFGMAYMEPWLMNTPVIGRNIPYIINDLMNSGMKFPVLYDTLNIPINGKIKDFAEFPESEQRDIINSALNNSQFIKDIFKNNSFLLNLLRETENEVIEHNKNVIRSKYSLENYGVKLYGIYKGIAGES